MDDILFIGIDPSIRSPDSSAFHPDTRSGKTIREWIVLIGVGGKRVSYLNLSDIHSEKQIQSYHKIIACGNKVSKTLDKLLISHFKVGHPSGLNRQWNDPIYKQEMLQKLKEYICDQPSI